MNFPSYCAKALTVAWRSVLLPARCFTRTVSLGWHHLTSVSREDLNAAHDMVSLCKGGAQQRRLGNSRARSGRFSVSAKAPSAAPRDVARCKIERQGLMTQSAITPK